MVLRKLQTYPRAQLQQTLGPDAGLSEAIHLDERDGSYADSGLSKIVRLTEGSLAVLAEQVWQHQRSVEQRRPRERVSQRDQLVAQAKLWTVDEIALVSRRSRARATNAERVKQAGR